MTITNRQKACFEKNSPFLEEVASVLLQIAATMTAESLVVKNTAESTAVEKAFAEIKEKIAAQILNEQGINVQNIGLPSAAPTATGGSTAMKYLVRQMLNMPTWTLTPDAWAADEQAAVAAITANMTGLLEALTAIPVI